MSNDRKEEMITVRLDRSLKARMDEREEINWSGVARKAIRNVIENLEMMDEIAAGNKLTEEEALEIAESVTESAYRRARAEREEDDRSMDSGTVATQ